jgi:2-methylcitrate dehydratase PrpD
VFDHPSGWYGASVSEGTADMSGPANSLGNPFRIQDAKYIRQYPCCRTNHGMLDSILGLMREHRFGYRDVESVEIVQSYGSIVMLYLEPENEHQARFSALFAAAAALVDGKVGIDTFTARRVKDPVIKEAMGKVHITVRSRWQERRGDHEAGIPVKIRLKSGRVLEHITPMDEIRGSQKDPLTTDTMVAKFRENASLALPAHKVDQAFATWSSLHEVEDVRRAVKSLVADGR